MARKSGADAAKAKAAKQKKILFALLGVLVIALFYAYHTMSASKSPAPLAASTTSTTGTETTPSTSGTTTPPAATPSTPTSTPVSTPAATPASTLPAPVLVAAAVPKAGAGQLQSFSRFESKDPFSSSGPQSSPATGSSATGGATPSSSGSTKTTKTVQPAAPPPSSAVIAVNGTAALVTSGSDFPITTDPTQNGLFHLVALTQTTAKIAIVGGSYASGAPTLTLKVNKPVTLANTADGKRYTLELFPQGTPAPAGSASSSSTSGTSTTTGP